jgi:DNA-binding transcriptional LysR family regulator
MDIPRLLDGRLKLRHLILVDALSEQSSVVGAAAALHVTQPVVTRSLHDLESILGVSLYERSSRGITPTAFGMAFTQHARAVIGQLTQAANHVAEIADADRGTVVVGSHLAGSNLLLPRAIAALKVDHPYLTVAVHEATPEALLVELEAGRVDILVGRLTAPADAATVRHALYEESVRLVAGAHHPARDRNEATVKELLDYPWILPGIQTVLRAELEQYFVRSHLSLPTNRVEATSFLTVRQLLIETDMIAVLPELIVWDDTRLSVLPVQLDESISQSVGMTLAAGRQLSPATSALVRQLRLSARSMKSVRDE